MSKEIFITKVNSIWLPTNNSSLLTQDPCTVTKLLVKVYTQCYLFSSNKFYSTHQNQLKEALCIIKFVFSLTYLKIDYVRKAAI